MSPGGNSSERKTYSARLATGLMIIGAIARLIPHPANFTPVGGTSLFAGARLRGWSAYLVPLILMAATDPILTAIYGYPLFGPVTPVIYGSFLINVWVGRKLLAIVNPRRIALASGLCSLQFFVLTNLGVWMLGTWYPHTFAGLMTCFAAALPFLGRTMAGDLAYAGFLFGLDAGLSRLMPAADRMAAATADAPAA
ncbi:MAG: hypothetical protein HY316_04250 [Acidobacteria bacterium]|nr:hypothetical protein [Acidobacteriota bacterium]